jgi:regulator of nonsense transcripts 2
LFDFKNVVEVNLINEFSSAEMIASMSRPAMVNLNRERKVRYQHPKGAPDADLIFGSK